MIRKLIVLGLILNSMGLMAQNSNEEAIILNQEMQFLEDSISNVQAATARPETDSTSDKVETIDSSLERTYFSDTEKDTIRTRTAAPVRRRSF